MDSFEIGRLLGRLDVLLADFPDKEDCLDELESNLTYRFDIMNLAKMYGRIEQKMITAHKSESDITSLRKLFKDIEKNHIIEFKKKTIKELRLRNFPLKSLTNNNIFTVEDISNKTIEEIASISGISKQSANMLEDVLQRNGVYLKK